MRVTGRWLGEYTYGPAYDALAGRSVPFHLSLRERFGPSRLLGLAPFDGSMRDEREQQGLAERGRIAGHRRRRQVRFVRSMRNYRLATPEGELVDLRTLVREQFGVEPTGELPPNRVDYEGELSPDGATMRGRWVILGCLMFGPGRFGDGTWTARRCPANDG